VAIASLSLVGAEKAIRFYEKAFNARVLNLYKDPTGASVMHGAIQLGAGSAGESVVFVSDYMPQWGGKPSDVNMTVYVQDNDAAFKRAIDAGAGVKQPPTDSPPPPHLRAQCDTALHRASTHRRRCSDC
jgi:PhnB protein